MKITIAERLHPFSHRPGAKLPLPLSSWQAQIFPTRICFQNLAGVASSFSLELLVKGPFKEFTAELDLERGCIRVFGVGKEGYLRYEIARTSDGILFKFEKLPGKTLKCARLDNRMDYEVTEKGTFLIPVAVECAVKQVPQIRLSLGMHKSQDWELLKRRSDLKELFPILMRLGEMVPCKEEALEPVGTMKLLDKCMHVLKERDKLKLADACEQWIQTAFSSVFAPRLADTEFQGILPPGEVVPENHSPLPLLTQGARLIKALFFAESEKCWDILPCLLPSFSAGRLAHVCAKQGEVLAMEWSKHQLKKLIVQTKQKRTVEIKLPKEIRSFRLRKSLKEKGQVKQIEGDTVALDLPEAAFLYLDCFKK